MRENLLVANDCRDVSRSTLLMMVMLDIHSLAFSVQFFLMVGYKLIYRASFRLDALAILILKITRASS